MTPIERHEARLARLLHIRRRVAAVAVGIFIATFAGLYVQMAMGHDPTLGATAVTQTAAAGDSTSEDDSVSVDPTGDASTAAPASSVTTSQS